MSEGSIRVPEISTNHDGRGLSGLVGTSLAAVDTESLRTNTAMKKSGEEELFLILASL